VKHYFFVAWIHKDFYKTNDDKKIKFTFLKGTTVIFPYINFEQFIYIVYIQ